MHMQLASSCLRIPTCLLGPQTIGHSERGGSNGKHRIAEGWIDLCGADRC